MVVTNFELNGKKGVYVSLGVVKEMQEKGEDMDKLKLDPSDGWWTVHHKDSDLSQASWISKGTGRVNRMGFIACSEDMFRADDGFVVFKSRKEMKEVLYLLSRLDAGDKQEDIV